MIFTAEEAAAMLAGRKTQTRRPRRTTTPATRVQDGRTILESFPVRRLGGRAAVIRPSRPVRGQLLPASRRKHPDELDRREQDERWLARVEGRRFNWPQITIGRLIVTDVRPQLAGDITFDDARAEGYPTVDDWKAVWLALHDLDWVTRHVDPDVTTLADVVHRFDVRHAPRPVWAITFHLDAVEAGRKLAARSEELYVHSDARALPEEPPAVSAQAQKDITARSGTVTQQWRIIEHTNRELEMALLSFDDRLARLKRAAATRRVNISSELRVVERLLAQRARPEAVDAQLSRAEAKVYRAPVPVPIAA